MLDHVTLRVRDLPAAEARFQALLDPLAMDQTLSSQTFAAWEEFMLTAPDEQHPPTRRAHVRFVAPSVEAAEEFRHVAGGAVLRDEEDNTFEVVVAEGRRDRYVERVELRVSDLAAAAAFYRAIAGTAGLTPVGDTAFGPLSLVAGPPTSDLHLAFGGDEAAVRRFHADAVAAGYRSNGEPGERRYHARYYAAYVLDPDGNNIEVVDHHRP